MIIACVKQTSIINPKDKPCLYYGNSILAGQTVSGYARSLVPYGQTCLPLTAICNGETGLLSNSLVSFCEVSPGLTCTYNNQTIPAGSYVSGYVQSEVFFGDTCLPQVGFCDGLSGLLDVIPNPSCEIKDIITYEAHFSEYGSCSVTNPCQGWGVKSREILNCHKITNYWNIEEVSLSYCQEFNNDINLNQSCPSTEGQVIRSFFNGYLEYNCLEGDNLNDIPASIISCNINDSVEPPIGNLKLGDYFMSSSPPLFILENGKTIYIEEHTEGNLTTYKLIKTNTDYSIDPTFNFSSTIKILYVSKINNNEFIILQGRNLIKLKSNGLVDPSFNYTIPDTYNIRSLHPTHDNKLFLLLEKLPLYSTELIRLNSNGTADNSFELKTLQKIKDIKIQPDHKVIVIMLRESYFSTSVELFRIKENGDLDNSFTPVLLNKNSNIIIDFQKNGQIILSGQFESVNGEVVFKKNDYFSYYGIIRLNQNGRLDLGFNSNVGAEGEISDILIKSDDKILISGSFTKYNNEHASFIVQLDPNGNIDTSFNYENGPNGPVFSMNSQSDCSTIISGYFTNYNNIPRNRLARINNDGSLDHSIFNYSRSNFNVGVKKVILQSDNKIIVLTLGTTYNGINIGPLVRLHPGGNLDTSFVSPIFESYDQYDYTKIKLRFYDVSLQKDGKILVAGNFSKANGKLVKNVVRLNSDGSLDSDFNTTLMNQRVYFSLYDEDLNIYTYKDFIVIVGLVHESPSSYYAVFLNLDGTVANDFMGYYHDISIEHPGKVVGVSSDNFLIMRGTFKNKINSEIYSLIKVNENSFVANNFKDSHFSSNNRFLLLKDDFLLVWENYSSRNYPILRKYTPGGDLDASFNIDSRIIGSIYEIIELPSEEFILLGSFQNHPRLIKVSKNGTLIESFKLTNLVNKYRFYHMTYNNGSILLYTSEYDYFSIIYRPIDVNTGNFIE